MSGDPYYVHAWRRRVRPLAFALFLTMVTLAVGNALGSGSLGRPWSVVVGIPAAGAAVLLGWGWVCQRWDVAEYGLLVCFGVLVERGSLLLLDQSAGFDAALSWSLAVAAGGAWWLERTERVTSRPRGDR